MRNFVALLVLTIIGVWVWKMIPLKNQQIILKKIDSTNPTLTPTIPISGVVKSNPENSIFVPDWSLTDEIILNNEYNRWIYFGGQDKIATFAGNLKDKELWFTLKVSDTEQLNTLVNSFNQLNQSGQFKGVVLDLEINGIGTSSLINQINKGIANFYDQVHKQNLKLAVVVYGDVFYRKRPYDLDFINAHSDEVMVMAYDFTKSYGEPGPNFPYQEFKKAVDEFLQHVPALKLTIVFGMYGYDWTLQDGKPLGPAAPLTLNEISKKFLGKKCYLEKCKVSSDIQSKEKHITYTDVNDHQVYFEDKESTAIKINYLKEKGIGSTAYWAWGYF